MPFNLQSADFVTIGLLVVLEGLLSADNALVMAVMVLRLPEAQHRNALRYGMVGGFAFRTIATLLAVYLIRVLWVKAIGGLYLGYLTAAHFSRARGGEAGPLAPEAARPAFGLSAFWATVIRVELVNLAFSIDSILVAVAVSQKVWVVVTGGVLGIVTMRLVAAQLIHLIKRYPSLVDAAFVVIGWVGLKLVLEYGHDAGFLEWEIPKWISLGAIVIVLAGAYVLARMREGRQPPATSAK